MRAIWGVLLLLLLTVTHVLSLDFKDPEDPLVTWFPPADVQRLSIKENNPLGLAVVIVTGASGEITLTFNDGPQDLFGPKIIPDGENFAITMEKSVNFEDLDSSNKRFLVSVGDNFGTKIFNMLVENVDDESPTIEIASCKLMENTTITIENIAADQCAYKVRDDGFLSTMDYTDIEDTGKNEPNLFEFKYKNVPDDGATEALVYLVPKPGVLLDFELTTLYIFELRAKDKQGGHPTTPLPAVQIIVQVDDMADTPPTWTSFPFKNTVPEKEETTFTVEAKDGDFLINNVINYGIENENPAGYAHVDPVSGVVTVNAINRDEGDGINQISFSVTAFEVADPTSRTSQDVTLSIEDKDDSIPMISVTGSDEKLIDIELTENYNEPIEVDIVVNDLDLGDNARYSVTLEKDPATEIDYTQAFAIVPARGVQLSHFSLTVTNVGLLDFEDENWRTITFTMHAVGEKTPANEDFLPITIHITDLNDNEPLFENDGQYTVSVKEDIGKGQLIKTVKATDADAGDVLTHTLLGAFAPMILKIDGLTGDITTIVDGAFDYEKQQQQDFLVQIQAADLGGHSTTAQLSITVEDVNDVTPRIVVASQASVTENQPEGTIIEGIEISATDEDTTADMVFSIDWERSRATKNSRPVADDVFANYHCIAVETISDGGHNLVTARLKIVETVPKNTPDFETFDTLFIQLVVTDQNQVHNADSDTAVVIISIDNLNDNAPVFSDDVKVPKSVFENAESAISFGSVTATDPDGDKVGYRLVSKDDTADWIAIDENSGALSVKEGATVDCDNPKRDSLVYSVIAFDDQNESEPVDLVITILDQNDEKPTMNTKPLSLEEKSPDGTIIHTFDTVDNDRDPAFNQFEHYMYTKDIEITSRFQVAGNNLVVALSGDGVLDRDAGPATFTLQVVARDNPTNQGNIQNVNNFDFTITLTDKNDHAPTITDPKASTNENLKKGETATPLVAVDIDEEGPNSMVDFEVKLIQRFEDPDHQTEIPDVPQDLFLVASEDAEHVSKRALVTANYDLKEYYGYFLLTISTHDFGDPRQTKDDNIVSLQVKKWNFAAPTISFPVEGTTYYLSTAQSVLAQLKLYNDAYLEDVQATDNQNDKYDIQFQVVNPTGNPEDVLFTVNDADTFGRSQGQLQLVKDNADMTREYDVQILANIDEANTPSEGEQSYTAIVSFKIGFFDQKTDPTFESNAAQVKFTENEAGLEERRSIPPATYSVDLPLNVFYILLPSEESVPFTVDQHTGTISLNTMLDFETTESYEIVIQASRNEIANPDSPDNTRLTVTVTVTDVNDNVPEFDRENYYSGIMTSYPSEQRLITAEATDLDKLDTLTYSIDYTSIKVSDPSLDTVISRPFTINTAGEIFLAFKVQPIMKGYFTFDIEAADPGDHKATAQVKIYIVSEADRINFRFENTLLKVTESTDVIRAGLDEEFKFTSNTETPSSDTGSGGEVLTNQTILPVYFIDTNINEPVSGDTILKQVSDITVYSRLRSAFLLNALILMPFASKDGATDNLEEVLRTWLIGVSVVLGTLCLILLIAFILKTRALNQRINNLSNPKFGSQESGLNRLGISAPTTNKHAIEGSNPVFNNEIDTKEIDHVSTASGDSELIGVEDNPEFGYENEVEEDDHDDDDYDDHDDDRDHEQTHENTSQRNHNHIFD